MSDWAPGDLIWCIDASEPRRFTPSLFENDGVIGEAIAPLARGRLYTIAKLGRIIPEVGFGVSTDDDPETPWLHSRFRKVTPPEADEFDRETIALLNSQPITEPGHFTPATPSRVRAKGEVSDSRRAVAYDRSAALLSNAVHDLGVGEP